MILSHKSHICVFCQASFTRSDALKRHWTTCQVRRARFIDIPEIATNPKGRKLKACDRCSRLKRACVSESRFQPCQKCALSNKPCSYRRIQTEHELGIGSESATQISKASRHDGFLPMDFEIHSLKNSFDANPHDTSQPHFSSDIFTSHSDLAWNRDSLIRALGMEFTIAESQIRGPTHLDLSVVASFPFLGSIARSSGLANCFECGSGERRSVLPHTAWKSNTYRETSSPLITGPHSHGAFASHSPNSDATSLESEYCWPMPTFANVSGAPLEAHQHWSDSINLGSVPLANTCSPRLNSTPQLPRGAHDSSFSPSPRSILHDHSSFLSTKCYQIINEIRQAVINKNQDSIITISWTDSLNALSYEFFHPVKVERFLALFWSCWHPNWPVVHRPTFDPVTSQLGLLMAVLLIGACLSTDQRDRAIASIWLNTVEEIVFRNEAFSGAMCNNLKNNNLREVRLKNRLGILQGAYCVCLLQTWEGSKESKRRIRRDRYNSLIWVRFFL